MTDFNVDLEFIVPFIRIPIERSMAATRTAFRGLLNLNAQSIFTTGAIVAIGGFFALILKIIFTQYALVTKNRKSFRHDDFRHQNTTMFNHTFNGNDLDNIFNINKFATVMESKLQENNINISHCIQSSLCSYAQKNFYTANKTCSEGLPRVLNGVLSLEFIQNYLSGTSIQSALDTAKNGDTCLKVFNNCNLSVPSSVMLKILTEHFKYLNIT